MKKDEVIFFGVTYTVSELEEAFGKCSDTGGPPLGVGPAFVTPYQATPLGALFVLALRGEGETPQAAAKDLERQVLKHFRKIGKAIGYVVE